MLQFLIKALLWIIVLLIIVSFFRTFLIEHRKENEQFQKGTLPEPMPEGIYKGTVSGNKLHWYGKKFDKENSRGINVFQEVNGKFYDKYPFKTSIGQGLRDDEIKVLKIDYNLPENPWWLRFVLDEIVEIAPGKYLGKLHLRLIPFFPFTLEYFNLDQQ